MKTREIRKVNRKAKRNKYKKIQRELERRIQFFEARSKLEHCFSKDVKIQQISCFKPIEDYTRLPANVIKEYYQKEVARQIAEEILKHQDFFKITDTGYGYQYDLSIVKID